MSYFIRIGKESVPVNDEIYREYFRMKRRERYMEKDIKEGHIDVNGERVTFVPSKEDSINRLLEEGKDFPDSSLTEDIVCDKAALLLLQKAMSELDSEEQSLINALYYKDLTVRAFAEEQKVSHVAIVKRHKKVLEKLKNIFSKSGYQT